MKYQNRTDAGRHLAAWLRSYIGQPNVIVLALPRGGVPVAYEVARALRLPLDVFLVRKIGLPFHPEVAMGAIAEGGVRVLNQHVIDEAHISQRTVDQVIARERLELDRRNRMYRRGRVLPPLKGRTIILVDDGLATGATMEAAVRALRELSGNRIVVAAPVGAADTCQRLRAIADEVVCPFIPDAFTAVGLWYQHFDQTTDHEVQRLLDLADEPRGKSDNPGRGPDPHPAAHKDARDIIRARARPLMGDPAQYQLLIDGVRDARVVLLGEATHGTHEFYRERAFITRRLITECGFTAVAVEADWPDAYRINRYVRGDSRDADAVDALKDFGRFPTWMWRNADVLDFVGWLRTYNDAQPPNRRAGFYGLDLYSLRASAQAVLTYLTKVDADAAARARARYACFDRFGDEMQQYGHAAAFGMDRSCEREVIAQLMALHKQRAEYVTHDGRVAPYDFFFAEQNARLVRNAEAYHRTMFRGQVESWNLRDRG
jgi:predicted phosphoribosyltransferase